ncbi:MAG: SusE domain-containing protein [Flavobacteriaceae bacterium]|nr:SusE domain-containing protein [Flavobacteriaceae bacterium]
MKNILKYIGILLPMLFIFSCEDDKELTYAIPTNAPIVLEAENTSVNLDANYKNTPALTLVWSHADYNVQTLPSYTIQFGLNSNFENAVDVITLSNRSYTWTVEQLNNQVQAMGMPPNEIGNLFIRVVSSLGNQQQLPMTSNVVSFDMVPYVTYAFDDYYMVGNATAAGWNPNNNNQALFRDPNNENLFHFTGYFDSADAGNINEGRFKLIEILGMWQPQWGDKRPEGEDTIVAVGEVAGNPATQGGDPGRFGVPASGYYTFGINFETLSYTVTPYDASGAAVYNTIGIIGDATPNGWDSDINMMRNEAHDPHNWYAQNVTLVNGAIKFRANDDWDVNWGGTTAYSGTGTLGGDNITVTSGVYNIWFNDLTGDYQLIPQD